MKDRFGEQFGTLSPIERMIMVATEIESTVNHARVSTICNEHPHDLSRIFKGLVNNDFLVQSGRSRGAVYYLPGTHFPTPDVMLGAQSTELGAQSTELGAQSTELGVQSTDLPLASGRNDGGRIVRDLPYPLIETLDGLNPQLADEMKAIARRTGGSGKVPRDVTRTVICELCRGRFLTLKILAELLNRGSVSLRINVLNPMVKSGEIARAFPATPNHPQQAYTTDTTPNGLSGD